MDAIPTASQDIIVDCIITQNNSNLQNIDDITRKSYSVLPSSNTMPYIHAAFPDVKLKPQANSCANPSLSSFSNSVNTCSVKFGGLYVHEEDWEKINKKHNELIAMEECKILKYAHLLAALRSQLNNSQHILEPRMSTLFCCSRKCKASLHPDIAFLQKISKIEFNIGTDMHHKLLNTVFYQITNHEKGLWTEMGFKSNHPEAHISNLLELLQLLFIAEHFPTKFVPLTANKVRLLEISFLCTELFIRLISIEKVQAWYALHSQSMKSINMIYCSLFMRCMKTSDSLTKFKECCLRNPVKAVCENTY